MRRRVLVRGLACATLATMIVACGTSLRQAQRPVDAGDIAPVTGAALPAPALDPDDDRVLVLEGPIDEAMRQRFHEAIESRAITTVRITSEYSQRGNNPRNHSALWIADAIRERGIEVVVRGMCAQSCANLVFVAGRKRRVEENSLVMFGPSVTTLQGTQQTIGELFPADFAPMFRSLDDLVAAEQRLFELRGVPLSLLRDSSFARQPHCVVFYRTDGVAPHSFGVNLTYAAWVPSRQYLAAAGLQMEGYWPASRKEMERVVRRLANGNLARATRFADEDHLRSRSKDPYKARDLRQCVLEQVAP